MSKKKNRKIIPYRKPHNINVGMIIFGIIFLYMLFNIFAYFRKDHVQFYEVMEGGIVNNKQYTGLILRDFLVSILSYFLIAYFGEFL